MLRNKFFIGILILLLVAVGIYNWRFFSQRNAGSKRTTSGPPAPTLEGRPEMTMPSGEERPEGDFAPEPKQKMSAKIREEWKDLLERKRWGRSPFLTPSEAGYGSRSASIGKTGQGGIADTVSAILIGEAGGVAVINHTIAAEGERVGEEQVTEIKPDRVLLRGETEERAIVIRESSVPITVE
jgi:hypothetical protein